MLNTPISDIELIIFDCDGVLVDSEGLSSAVLAEMLNKNGCQTFASDLRTRFHGMKLRSILERLELETGVTLPAYFEEEFREKAAAVFEGQLQPIAGASSIVGALRIPFCIASSGPRSKIEQNLQTTNLLPYFIGRIFSAYEINSWKPDPGLFLAAAKHFGISPDRCMVVEDSVVGVDAGLAAEMTVLGLGPIVKGGSSLPAGRVFDSLEEIHQLLVAHGLAHDA